MTWMVVAACIARADPVESFVRDLCALQELPARDEPLSQVRERLGALAHSVAPPELQAALDQGMGNFSYVVDRYDARPCPYLHREEQWMDDQRDLDRGRLRYGAPAPRDPAWLRCGGIPTLPQFEDLDPPADRDYAAVMQGAWQYEPTRPPPGAALIWVDGPDALEALPEGPVILAFASSLDRDATRAVVAALNARRQELWSLRRPLPGPFSARKGLPVDADDPDCRGETCAERVADLVSARIFFEHPERPELLSETVACGPGLDVSLVEGLLPRPALRMGPQPILLEPLHRTGKVRVMGARDTLGDVMSNGGLPSRIVDGPIRVALEDVPTTRRWPLEPMVPGASCTALLEVAAVGSVHLASSDCEGRLRNPQDLEKWAFSKHLLEGAPVPFEVSLQVSCDASICSVE